MPKILFFIFYTLRLPDLALCMLTVRPEGQKMNRLLQAIWLLVGMTAAAHAASACSKVTAPTGVVSICGNTITATSAISHRSTKFVVQQAELLGWFNAHGTDAAGATYNVGGRYAVPIPVWWGGNCSEGSTFYVVIFGKTGLIKIKSVGNSYRSVCIYKSNTEIFNNKLRFTISNRDHLAIYHWYLAGGEISMVKKAYPVLPDGYSMLASVGPFGTNIENGIPLVQSAKTQYGPITFNKHVRMHIHMGLHSITPGPYGLTGGGAFSLNDVDIPRSSLIGGVEGFASRTFSLGDKAVVVVEGRPDEMEGERYQIIEIGPHHIRFSRIFGTGYGFIGYRQQGDRLDFLVGKYATSQRSSSPGPDNSESSVVTGFKFCRYTYAGDHLAASAGCPAPHKPLLHKVPMVVDRKADAKQPWFYITTDFHCEPMKGSMHFPDSPAALIEFDQINNHMADQVLILDRDRNGTPTEVVIGEPNFGQKYEFIRGRARCEGIAAVQFQKLKGLE